MNFLTVYLVGVSYFVALSSAALNINEILYFSVRQYSLLSNVEKDRDNNFFSTGNPLNTEWNPSTDSNGWTVGFYPGSLWKLYKLTQDEYWKTQAQRKQELIRFRELDTGTHDVGFIIMCSFGLGLKITGDRSYESVIVQTAHSLSTRFHRPSGSIRSWGNWDGVTEVKVIADNMMNLELLFKATEISGNQTFTEIAISHANQTILNHFRPDGGVFHVVGYNEVTGQVSRKFNVQGYADWSTWSRALAWVIHGFTTTYEYTRTPIHLEYAEKAAKYFIDNSTADAEDGIPYFDFDCPFIVRYQPRDSAAAAIASHAFLKLYLVTEKQMYLSAAEKLLEALNSPSYRADGRPGYNLPAILVNGTVYYNQNDFDTAIVYGDYYFLEAIDLYQQITQTDTYQLIPEYFQNARTAPIEH